MFSAAVIVFREIFEIAIIVTVILAATKNVPTRTRWVSFGGLIGTCLVAAVALFAQTIARFAGALNQHIFHAGVLLFAASLIGWSVVWMQTQGKQIAQQMRALGRGVSTGEVPLYMLAIVVGLAVLREGSEIVLFLYGLYAGNEATALDLLIGLIAGGVLGIATGIVMYLGLMRIPFKQLFLISGWLLTFLAAGMVAKATGHLIAANILPTFMNPLWDSSFLLSQKSLIGRFLATLIGYQDHPADMQVFAYLCTILLISRTILPNKIK